ncbi:MAG TPA: hypoxanthine phosphoribosyltransferase [Anaerolineales bacterium]|nr:hypoxanthine phosphoribosyltransferase [Anaerolineales bacterium]
MGAKSSEEYAELTKDISEILISTTLIQEKVSALGEQISQDYAQKNPLLVGVLKGVLLFMSDLLRAITIPVEVDFMAVSSYSAEARERGLVRLVKDLETPITDRNILFVEDVVDTGLTLNYLLGNLRSRRPASLEVCTLFNKSKHRLIDLPIRYAGFDLPDLFVVGYGLDYRERYRNLPFVGLLKPEVFRNEPRK